jgi:asparagine N-glycosylation enzyme membrane subunit Stt3
MFSRSWNARYVLRGVVAALLVALATLRASLGDGVDTGEWIDVGTNTLTALAAYLGIGAALGPVEPFVGRKLDDADVPKPPADPVPPA